MRQTTADSNAPAKSKPRLRKFHIGTGQSDQEVIDQFVVRQNELDRILEVLAGNIDSDSCQHLLLVGPRGRGKTMLLVRVIAELHIDAHLAEGLLPVRLMEESQEIFTLADFWLECLYFLAKACEPIDQAIAEDLRASHAALTAQWADPALESRARASVLDAADRLDRKLVIMIENLQALSREADSTFGWDLRQVLQTEPQVMLLATATSHFAALEDAEQPFFELFRTLHLPPLDTEECRQLWQAISHERVDTRQIRPLRILTGGSPRLMVVLAGFSRDRSLRQLMDHLVELIDDHTEYFRSHIEDLASSERRVYLALIDLWQESSSAEIAARARMDIRKVSTYLGRLVERGAVLVEGTGRNRSYYAAERLYSIYYKLRRDRDEAAVVRNLIHFMVTYYHGTELTELSRRLVLEAKQSAGIREGLARAAQEDAELRNLLQAQGMQVPQMADRRLAARNISASELSGESLLSEGAVGAEAADTLDQMRRLYESGDFEAMIRLADAFVAADLDHPAVDPAVEARLVSLKAQAQLESGDSAAAIETYDALLARFGDSALPKVQVQLARAMVNKGYSQGQLGDSAAEIETYDALLARFGDSALPEVQVQLAWAMVNKGDSQGQLGDSAAAIETYDALLARFGDSALPEVQVQLAWAMVNKGVTQRQLGDSAAAIETYDALLARFGDSALPEVQESVAMAMVNKGYSQGQLGDSAAEIETYDALLARFGDSALPELQDAVGMVTRNIAERLCMLGDAAAALQRAQALRTLASRQTATEPLLHADWVEAMARALLGETTRVEALFRGILSRFDGDDQQMVHDFQKTVPTLVALGADPGSLAGVLEEYPHALEALRPLAVALRLEAGDKVRAPSEMLEVAEDIRAEIDEQRGQRAR
jgi:phage gp36-like protein